MARQPSHRPEADEPEHQLDETSGADDPTEVEADPESADTVTGPVDRSLWDDVRIEPVEIALPSGAGFTLRAYRPAAELTPTDVAERDEDDPFLARSRQGRVDEDEEEVIILDEEFAAALREDADDTRAEDAGGKRSTGAAEADKADADEIEEEEEEEEEAAAGAEEVPAFLTHRGRLLLFKSPESLVSFIRSGAPNDLAQLDTWSELVERVQPADIAPLDEDSYELDLVVENLRGGHDTWDSTLLIEAGEAARDLAYALRLPAILDMLAPGSSLDDLDEALRSASKGGLGGFLGRRRLRKIGAQTASLGWRTIIGKISAVVDWRD